MLKNRIENPTGKNACYAGVKLLISREDFIKWFTANDFEGCTVDRKSPLKHYEVGNLQLLTKRENSGKDKRMDHNGLCRCYSCKKVKKLELFVKSSRKMNGYSTICLECENERTRLKNMKVS